MKNNLYRLLSLFLLVSNGCIVIHVPAPIPPNPQPPTTSTTPQGEKTTSFFDPDNLKVVFKKENTTVYHNTFGGKVRAAAKTTPSVNGSKQYATVGDVLKTLPSDSYMRRLGVGDSSPRTDDEQINVFIKTAYVFFISKEEDGDIHLIIGDLDKNGEKINLMTAEVSGLPQNKNTQAYFLLERTRRQFYEEFPEFFEGNRKTFKPRTQFPEIAIRGSLFFDTHHSVGQIGSGSAKPETVWEIHPVTYLEFKKNK